MARYATKKTVGGAGPQLSRFSVGSPLIPSWVEIAKKKMAYC